MMENEFIIEENQRKSINLGLENKKVKNNVNQNQNYDFKRKNH